MSNKFTLSQHYCLLCIHARYDSRFYCNHTTFSTLRNKDITEKELIRCKLLGAKQTYKY